MTDHRFRAHDDTSSRTRLEEAYEQHYKEATGRGARERAAHMAALEALAAQAAAAGYQKARREIASPIRDTLARALLRVGEWLRP